MRTQHHHLDSYLPVRTPALPTESVAPPATDHLLEDALRTILRQHYPTYRRLNGHQIRNTMNKAFVEFVLERSRGNQFRAAEAAGLNRNTLRRLIRAFAINWKKHATQ